MLENREMFENLGQVLTEISKDEVVNLLVTHLTAYQKRQCEAEERQADALEHIVKLLKPWAEREKRRNMLEQDPEYLKQVANQIINDRKSRAKS
jgi:hypothetical protein